MSNYQQALTELQQKLGNKESLIALATTRQDSAHPAARLVSTYYEDGVFYTTTHASTNKVKQIADNPQVAVCVIVESFTADGLAENLGWVKEEKNAAIMTKVREAFSEWYDDANDDDDPATCLLRIQLTQGLWNFPHEGQQKRIDFINQTVTATKV